MQNIFPTSFNPQLFLEEHPILNDPLLEVFSAILLNTSVFVYHLPKTQNLQGRQIKVLGCLEIFKKTIKTIHPLIPISTLFTTTALIGLIALKYLNKKNAALEKYSRRLARFSIVNTLALSYFTFFIHEFGHAALAVFCFKNSGIKIAVIPFKAGSTTYAISYGITTWGLKLGKEQALLMITAGGIAASFTASLVLAYASKTVRNINAFSAEVLQNIGLTQVLAEIIYGVASLIEKNENCQNDFTSLYMAGNIHPTLPLTLLGLSFVHTIY